MCDDPCLVLPLGDAGLLDFLDEGLHPLATAKGVESPINEDCKVILVLVRPSGWGKKQIFSHPADVILISRFTDGVWSDTLGVDA